MKAGEAASLILLMERLMGSDLKPEATPWAVSDGYTSAVEIDVPAIDTATFDQIHELKRLVPYFIYLRVEPRYDSLRVVLW